MLEEIHLSQLAPVYFTCKCAEKQVQRIMERKFKKPYLKR